MTESQRYAVAGLLGAAGMVLFLVLLFGGCSFRAGLVKAHKGVKLMSSQVEPRLAAECLRRARVCRAQHIGAPEQCGPLRECRDLKRRYLHWTTAIHRGLRGCRVAYDDMVKAGVIR